MKECIGCQNQLGMNVKKITKWDIKYPQHANKNANYVDQVVQDCV